MFRRGPLRPQIGVPSGMEGAYAGGTWVPTGLGPALIAPSQPGALGPERGVYVRLPGADFPPAGAIALDEIGDGDLAAGASATLVTVRVPDTYRFRAAGIGFSADDETALRFLTWFIRATPPAAPVPGYVNMRAAVGSVQQLSFIFYLFGSSVLVEVVATNTSGAALPLHFVCRLQGWFYSEKEPG